MEPLKRFCPTSEKLLYLAKEGDAVQINFGDKFVRKKSNAALSSFQGWGRDHGAFLIESEWIVYLFLFSKYKQVYAALASFIAFHIVCGVAGIVKFVTPTGFNASWMAFITAAIPATVPPSPAPFTPSGFCLVGTG